MDNEECWLIQRQENTESLVNDNGIHSSMIIDFAEDYFCQIVINIKNKLILTTSKNGLNAVKNVMAIQFQQKASFYRYNYNNELLKIINDFSV